jgi:tetratricopeptide (TPR) repeat protein
MSAYELLKQIDLDEEAISCLFMAGRETQATNLANKILEKDGAQKPGILCLMGDIKRDPSYYEKAWEVSGKRYARAKRSMARIKFHRGLFQESADDFKEALEISKLFPEAWFTQGCAYMRIENF